MSGISDAYYCSECTRLEKDRDGCPKIVNLGASRTDLFYERRRLGTPAACENLVYTRTDHQLQASKRVDYTKCTTIMVEIQAFDTSEAAMQASYIRHKI